MNDENVMIIDESEIERLKQKYNVQPLKNVNHEDYKEIGIEDMRASPPLPQQYIFHPCLPRQGICWIYAATGLGKTLFTLNLAYAIATGGSFLKYDCEKPRKVLYVDGEMSYNQIYSRFIEIVNREGELDFPGNIKFLTPDKILPLRMPKIDTEEGQMIYKEKLLAGGWDVVIFDNLAMLSSFDENKAHEWKPIQEWLLHLRSLGITIIMIHHSGKDKNGYRGTSGMMDCADVTISLQPINENDLEEDLVSVKKFKVKYGKARSFGGVDALPYEVTFTNGVWQHQSMENRELQMISEMVALKMTQMAIAKEMGCGQSKIAKLVKKARKLGLIPD